MNQTGRAGSPGRGLVVLVLALLLAGCAAQRPVLYPNDQLRRAGTAVADRDINFCMSQADEYTSSSSRAGKVAEGAVVQGGTSAAIGAAAGAAGGAIVGRAGPAAAVGAAGGLAAGTVGGLISGLSRKENPSPLYRNFVDRCLRERGYDPIGWE